HDRAAHRHALALAAGQLPGLAAEHRGQLENPRGFLHAGVDFRLGHAAIAQAIGHVVVDAHMRVERVILEYHRNVAVGRLDLVDDAAADIDLARGDGLEPGDHPEQRRLAAAGGADQHAELAVGDIDIDAFDRFEAVRIGLADVAESYISHVSPGRIASGEWRIGKSNEASEQQRYSLFAIHYSPFSLLRLDQAFDEQPLQQHHDRDRRQHGEHGSRHRDRPFGERVMHVDDLLDADDDGLHVVARRDQERPEILVPAVDEENDEQ